MNTKFNRAIVKLWGLAVASFSLLSPKWVFASIAWFAPVPLLMLFDRLGFWKALLWGWTALFVAGLIAGYGVMPFPGIFFVIMTIFTSAIQVIPYVINKMLIRKLGNHWITTLIFPSVLVVSEYLNAFGGGGTWGSIAYTQADHYHLIQLASVFGIWGITFLIGWFASLLRWSLANQFEWKVINMPVKVFTGIVSLSLLYGLIKTNSYFEPATSHVRVAGITANNATLVKAMYEDYFDKKIDVDPDELTQTSPELFELQKAFIPFIENPYHNNFNTIHHQIAHYHDSLLALAGNEARAGAKLIAFSEGLFLVLKDKEPDLIEKGSKIARENNVYIALSLASLLNGKVELGSKYIENKIVFINPKGEVESVFFKNKPVPVVEGSVPGDGQIPVVETSFGRVALSICYDADYPSLMRKASSKGADIMILPSGDWREISPYHAQMAILRAVENGFSLFRMASGATSVAADFNGRILSKTDFYTSGERIMTSYLPVRGRATIYSVTGDVLPWLCSGFLVVLMSLTFFKKIEMFSVKLAPLQKDSIS